MSKVFRPSDVGQEVDAGDSLADFWVAIALILASLVMMAL